MKRAKIDNSGQIAAERAQAESRAIANNLQKNFQTDLKTDNISTVVAGAGAEDALDTGGNKRKKTGQGLSSQLGIDI